MGRTSFGTGQDRAGWERLEVKYMRPTFRKSDPGQKKQYSIITHCENIETIEVHQNRHG